MSKKNMVSSKGLEPLHLEEYDGSFFDNEILTTDEIAKRLRLSPKTIYRMVQSGEIPFFKVRGSHRFQFQEVLQCLKQRSSYENGSI